MIKSSAAFAARNRNLDLLRAIAILMVVAGHLVLQSPRALPRLKEITDYGQYGVDLFFVLSGWLIGGLYWREHRAFGSVAIISFWMRRWLRTIPPYLVALLIAWLGAHALRKEPFDAGYLVFLQNYYDQLPFFLVSWSLCVEEHFYLLAPVFFLLLRWIAGTRATIACFLVLAIASPALRFLEYPALSNSFAYTHTASHLRMDGLVFGCLLSFLVTEVPRTFQFLSRIAPYAIFVLAALLFAVDRTGGESWYVLWGTLTALFFAALLILAVCGKEIGAGIARVAGPVALASYSLYLTHAWGLTLAHNIAGRFSDAAPLLYFLVAALAIAALATLNYVLVERTSIQFRDTYWPRKLTAAATPARASLQASN